MSKQTKTIDPKEKKHHDEQRAKRLQELQSKEPDLYAKMSGSREDQDAYIALRGGLPKYTAPAKPAGPPPAPKTNWKDLTYGTPKRKPAGYRYNAGEGKPAKESITKRGKIKLK